MAEVENGPEFKAPKGLLRDFVDYVDERHHDLAVVERDFAGLSSKFRDMTGWLMNRVDLIYLQASYFMHQDRGRLGTIDFAKRMKEPGGAEELWEDGRRELASITLKKTLEKDTTAALRSPRDKMLLGEFNRDDIYALKADLQFGYKPVRDADGNIKMEEGRKRIVREDGKEPREESVPELERTGKQRMPVWEVQTNGGLAKQVMEFESGMRTDKIRVIEEGIVGPNSEYYEKAEVDSIRAQFEAVRAQVLGSLAQKVASAADGDGVELERAGKADPLYLLPKEISSLRSVLDSGLDGTRGDHFVSKIMLHSRGTLRLDSDRTLTEVEAGELKKMLTAWDDLHANSEGISRTILMHNSGDLALDGVRVMGEHEAKALKVALMSGRLPLDANKLATSMLTADLSKGRLFGEDVSNLQKGILQWNGDKPTGVALDIVRHAGTGVIPLSNGMALTAEEANQIKAVSYQGEDPRRWGAMAAKIIEHKDGDLTLEDGRVITAADVASIQSAMGIWAHLKPKGVAREIMKFDSMSDTLDLKGREIEGREAHLLKVALLGGGLYDRDSLAAQITRHREGIVVSGGRFIPGEGVSAIKGMIDATVLEVEIKFEYNDPNTMLGMLSVRQGWEPDQSDRAALALKKVTMEDGTIKRKWDLNLDYMVEFLNYLYKNTRA